MSQVADFRVYQSAVMQAQRANVPRAAAVHAVAEARKEGASGQQVIGQLLRAATRTRIDDFDPRPAA